MATMINQQPTGTSLASLFTTRVADEKLLSVFPQSTLDGVKALKHAIDDSFGPSAIARNVTELPSRRSHILRPQAQAISRLLFPDYSPDKAIIQYENSRRKVRTPKSTYASVCSVLRIYAVQVYAAYMCS